MMTLDLRRNKGSRFDVIQKIYSTILPPFIVCACVQIISTEEEKLHEVPYICNWYKETPEKRKDLLMLMTRTIMPTTINYRLVFRMDHQCLANRQETSECHFRLSHKVAVLSCTQVLFLLTTVLSANYDRSANEIMVTLIQRDISSFKMVYYGMKYLGFNHSENRPWSLVYIAIHWILISYFGIFSVVDVFLGSGILKDVIEALSGAAIYLMTVSKLYNLVFKEKEIRSLLNRLENVQIKILKDPRNTNRVNKAKDVAWKIIMITAFFVMSSPIINFIFTTIDDYKNNFKNKRFYVKVWFPWSIEDKWPYLASKVFTTVITESVVFTNAASGMLQITFTFQISAYLKILQRYFETEIPADRAIYEQHKVLIQLIQDYKSLFSGQMYLETVVSPVLPCGYGLTMIRELRRNDMNQLGAIQRALCPMMIPFVVCACVQMICTEVEKLHEASYMCNWYEQTPKVKKTLLIMMTRTTIPTTINYRTVFRMDHQCLATVLQGLYSFFTLAINFDNE